MSDEDVPEKESPVEWVMSGGGFADQVREFDLRYLTHPAVGLLYFVSTPLLMAGLAGVALDVLWWEAIAAAIVVAPAGVMYAVSRARPRSRAIRSKLVVIAALIVVSQTIARLGSPDVVLDAPIGDRTPGPEAAVLAVAIGAYSLQHLLLWLVFTVLVAGSVSYRKAKKDQLKLAKDMSTLTGEGDTESALTKKQRDSVAEISRRIAAIEESLVGHSSDDVEDLVTAVRELRQEVVRPSLAQLNTLLAEARSVPHLPASLEATVASVPWRWERRYFSGTVGALLIGVVGLALLAPASYYFPGLLIQLGLIIFAFFVSVPAALLLFSAAALTPVLDPSAQSAGGFAVLALIAGLGAVSFLQRFNSVRRFRALESQSVTAATLAFEQVRRSQDLRIIEERVNSILHGSVQSTLLALELGLQSGDESVFSHTAGAIEHVRESIAKLEEPTATSSQRFERAVENILTVWAGSVAVSVDISPDAADSLNRDPLAASAAIEVVKEGTQNAVKHANSREILVTVSKENSTIRVRVSHASAGNLPKRPSTGQGMQFLRAITSTLRLVDDGDMTTLYAEIPTRPMTASKQVT